jgi:hypothetical protein
MKKYISLVAGGALLLSLASIAFAKFPPMMGDKGSEVTVNNNGSAGQDTTAIAKSETGDNYASSGMIWTGDAMSEALSGSYANYFTTKILGSICGDCVKDLTVNNYGSAGQDTTAIAKADTGDNTVGSMNMGGCGLFRMGGCGSSGSGKIFTGDAYSGASAESWANIFTTKIGTMFGR